MIPRRVAISGVSQFARRKLVRCTAILRTSLRCCLLLALASALIVCMPAAFSSARPVTTTQSKKGGKKGGKVKPTYVPSCASFEGQVASIAPVNNFTGPGLTELGGGHSLCSWSGQPAGQYAFVVTVAVFPAPAHVGKDFLKQAKDEEIAAEHKPGGFGEYVTGNPRRGRFFQGMAFWGEESPNKETGKCPAEVNAEGIEFQNMAIEPNQTGPSCAGQPGTEGDFATGYGSARRSTAPIILEISVACQLDTSGGPFRLARAEIAGFSRKY